MRFPHGVTVTVVRGGTDPRTGDPLPSSEHAISGVAVAPRYATESTTTDNATITGLTLYLPYGADLRATDTVRLPNDPDPWYVDGEKGSWLNPYTGTAEGDEVALTRQKG